MSHPFATPGDARKGCECIVASEVRAIKYRLVDDAFENVAPPQIAPSPAPAKDLRF